MSTLKEFDIQVSHASELPIYAQIASCIKAQIVAQGAARGTALPVLKSIAQAAGVSLRTAERGVNELVKEGICFRRPKKGTFVGEPTRKVATQPVFAIYPYGGQERLETVAEMTATYRGIQSESGIREIAPLILASSPDKILYSYNQNDGFDLCGVLMVAWDELQEGERLAQKFPALRIVFLNHHLSKFENTPDNVFGVYNDCFSGAYQMMENLLLGEHKRICLLTLDIPATGYRERIHGFQTALKNAGIPPAKILCDERKPHEHSREPSRRLAQRVLQAPEHPTLIACTNDYLAQGVREEFKKAGREITVVGYDNLLPDISRESSFSTVSIDSEQIGKKAVEIVMSPRNQYPKITRIAPQIIMRTKPPPAV